MNRGSNTTVKAAFNKVTHVIFDLDGLLLDTENIYTEATNNIVQQYGKTYDWSIKSQLMGLTGQESAKEFGRDYKHVITNIAKEHGKFYSNEVRLKVLGRPDVAGSQICVSELKLPLTTDQFLQEFRNRAKKLLPSCPLMPGAERLIKHLHKKQVPIAVATSSTQESFELKTAKYKDMFSLFNHIVAGGSDPDVKQGKPSPDIFLVCASRFLDKPKPEQCLVLEDAPNGVTAATKAGMQCIMVPDPHIGMEQTKYATQVLKSLKDIRPEDFGLPPLNGL